MHSSVLAAVPRSTFTATGVLFSCQHTPGILLSSTVGFIFSRSVIRSLLNHGCQQAGVVIPPRSFDGFDQLYLVVCYPFLETLPSVAVWPGYQKPLTVETW
jgi:hypothetical protein